MENDVIMRNNPEIVGACANEKKFEFYMTNAALVITVRFVQKRSE